MIFGYSITGRITAWHVFFHASAFFQATIQPQVAHARKFYLFLQTTRNTTQDSRITRIYKNIQPQITKTVLHTKINLC